MTLVALNDGSRNSNFDSPLRSTVVWSGSIRPHAFRELADARRPAIDHAKTSGHDGQLRHADESDDADEEEVAVGFLADFFAQQRGLQVGEDSGGLHK